MVACLVGIATDVVGAGLDVPAAVWGGGCGAVVVLAAGSGRGGSALDSSAVGASRPTPSHKIWRSRFSTPPARVGGGVCEPDDEEASMGASVEGAGREEEAVAAGVVGTEVEEEVGEVGFMMMVVICRDRLGVGYALGFSVQASSDSRSSCNRQI